MIRCLNCGKKNYTLKGRGISFLHCSAECTWEWRDNIHFVDIDWHIPALNCVYFIDLDINKRYG